MDTSYNNPSSIWLRQLGINMLNTGDTPLSIAHRYTAKLFNADATVISLSEPESEELKSICVRNGYASLRVIEDVPGSLLADIIHDVRQRAHVVYSNGYFAIPMSSSQAEYYGVLIFETSCSQWSSEKDEAVKSFCEIIYEELMGGFMQSSRRSVMQVQDICVCYDRSENGRNAVDHVSVDIGAGELTVIMGRSGCGKSSLLNVMSGLLTPCSGQVIWRGKNICTMKSSEKTVFRRDDLGFIFQNYNLIGELTAKENISIAAVLSHTEASVNDAISLVELSGKENLYPRQLSGGEQQRVAIARALVKNPSLLLCDEPTGALDTANAKRVMCLLQNIAREKGVPVVVVTHNSDYAVLADHYIMMKDGYIEEEFYRHFPYSAERIL